jgi:hypothetical protein
MLKFSRKLHDSQVKIFKELSRKLHDSQVKILQGSWPDHCNLKREKERKRHSSMVCESWWAPDGIG